MFLEKILVECLCQRMLAALLAPLATLALWFCSISLFIFYMLHDVHLLVSDKDCI